MEWIHLYGAYFINYLQSFFPTRWQEEFFFLFSHIGDPKNAFILYFPLVFAFNKCEGKKLIVVAVVSEWLNLILKWCLRGERPYWWVNEANVNVSLKQFYLTCETGPGSPSGHVMVTCAVGVFLVLFLTNQHKPAGQSLKLPVWLVYILIVFLVSLSRIFIAAHFPHQIIFAFFLGNVIGAWIWKDTTNRLPRFYFVASMCLILVTLLFYQFLSLFFDPAFSIPKAMKWCSNKDFIKLDTTPLYGMVRDSGAILGIGISELLGNHCRAMDDDSSLVRRIFQAMLSIFFAKCVETIPLPTDEPFVFYLLGYLKNSALVVIVIIVIPLISIYLCDVKAYSKITTSSQSKKAKK